MSGVSIASRPKPSQLSQREYATPFVACFARFEREYAAALYVEACARRGDEWQAIGPREFLETLTELMAEQPRINWLGFAVAFGIQPDVPGLVEAGWLEWADKIRGPVKVTDQFIERAVHFVGQP